MLNQDKSIIEYSIDVKAYERILNNVMYMAPLEIGVEVGVYMLLFGIINQSKYSLLDVDTMAKRKALVYANNDAKNRIKVACEDNNELKVELDKVPDLVVVKNEFKYNKGAEDDSNKNGACGFIEVKGLTEKFYEYELDVQKNSIKNYIWTNGILWKYFVSGKEHWSINLKETSHDSKLVLNKEIFSELLIKLAEIEWEN